jgi:hypothetical protein
VTGHVDYILNHLCANSGTTANGWIHRLDLLSNVVSVGGAATVAHTVENDRSSEVYVFFRSVSSCIT